MFARSLLTGRRSAARYVIHGSISDSAIVHKSRDTSLPYGISEYLLTQLGLAKAGR